MPTPWRRAHSEARWMSGPSAIGSENGTPTSTASAPARSTARSSSSVRSSDGNPAVRYGIKPVAVAREANAGPMRDAREASGARVTMRVAAGAGATSVRRAERIPVAVATAHRVQLERRAHVAHLDPEQRVRARPPRQVEALEEERVGPPAHGVRPERVADAHAHAERSAELVGEPRDLERARHAGGRAHAHRRGEVEARRVEPRGGAGEARDRHERDRKSTR